MHTDGQHFSPPSPLSSLSSVRRGPCHFERSPPYILAQYSEFIATSTAWDPILIPTPLQYDVHVYNTPSEYSTNSHNNRN